MKITAEIVKRVLHKGMRITEVFPLGECTATRRIYRGRLGSDTDVFVVHVEPHVVAYKNEDR
jgi:hypothetical protein